MIALNYKKKMINIDLQRLFEPKLYGTPVNKQPSHEAKYGYQVVYVDDNCEIHTVDCQMWYTKAAISKFFQRWIRDDRTYEFIIYDAEGHYALYLGRSHEHYRYRPIEHMQADKLGMSIGYLNK